MFLLRLDKCNFHCRRVVSFVLFKWLLETKKEMCGMKGKFSIL